MSEKNVESRISDAAFAAALSGAGKSDAATRRHVCLLFSASIADAMESKQTTRLNAAWGAVRRMKIAGDFKKSLNIFSGGYVYKRTRDGLVREYAPERAMLAYDQRAGVWSIRPHASEEWKAAYAAFLELRGMDYDAPRVKPATRQRTIAPVLKQLKELREHRHELSALERGKFIELWEDAIRIFPELGESLRAAPAARTTDRPVDITGK